MIILRDSGSWDRNVGEVYLRDFCIKAPFSALASSKCSEASHRFKKISCNLASRHWFPAHFSIDFKMLQFTFKAQMGPGPLVV